MHINAINIIVPVAGLLTSALLTWGMRCYALKFDVMDMPGNRSSHQIPTPRGGGLAIVISMLAIGVTAGFTTSISSQAFYALLLPGVAIAIISFIDDHQPLPSGLRLIVHFFAACLSIVLLPNLPAIPVGEFTLASPWILYPLLTLSLVWLLNLYNFMDGIDGIAGGEAVSVLLAAASILWLHGERDWSTFLLWCSTPIVGFLYWNWPPAKIFMGDVGSAYLGITLGILALLTSADTPMTLWSWLILLAVFIADATWTLLVRMTTGQDWHQPHRSHAYQKVARHKKSHRFVSLGVIAINLIWLAPLAWIATVNANYGWAVCALAYLPLLGICRQQSAGQPSTDNESFPLSPQNPSTKL